MLSAVKITNNRFEFNGIDGFLYTNIGNKLIMEDYNLIYKIDDNIYIFGIFDGHGNYYIAKQLPILFKKYITSLSDINIKNLVDICYIIDKELYNSVINNKQGGSTVLLVIYTTK